MKKTICAFVVLLVSVTFIAGCTNGGTTVTYSYPTSKGDKTQSISDQRCYSFLSLEEAAQLTGISYEKMKSKSEDITGVHWQSDTSCEYSSAGYVNWMDIAVSAYNMSLKKGSSFSAYRDERATTLSNMGQDAYYSPEPNPTGDPEESKGVIEVLINDQIALQFNSNLDRQTAEKVARAVVKNFEKSGHYKELLDLMK